MRLATLLCVTIAVCAAAPFLGMTFADDETRRWVILALRLPRVGAAALAGMTLALCGMFFQALFRNDLASPYTLGVSSGASFGAALAIVLGFTGFGGLPGVSITALAGALTAVMAVWQLSLLSRRFGAQTMLLAGVAVGFFFSGLTVVVQYLADYSHGHRILHWLMGSLDTAGKTEMFRMAPFFLIAICASCFHRELDILTLGEEAAAARGVAPRRITLVLFALTSLAVAGIVAVTGPIGFIGLMAPHIARMIVGPRHCILAPATLLTGASLLVSCDTLARTVIAPAEIPVGAVTALLGAPFFVWLLVRRAP